MSITLTGETLASLAVTLVAVLGLGMASASRARSAEGFSLAGRKAGIGLMSGNMAGAIIGGAATIGTAQAAFRLGLSAWWFTLGSGLGFILMAAFFARPLRNTRLETIAQFLVLHYGPGAGPLTAIASSLGILFSAVASSLSGLHLIGALLGLSPGWSAAIIVILVLAYVLFGGMAGAGKAGLAKMAILWTCLVVAGAGAVHALSAQADFAQHFPTRPWLDLMGPNHVDTLGNVASLIVGVLCTQTYVQAIYAATDSRTARRGCVAAAALVIPVGLPSVAIGMAMRAEQPDLTPILALPAFFVGHLPGWLAGIGLAGILLSVVGSIAGLVLGIGTMMANDIGRAVLHVGEGRRVLWLNRAVVALVSAAAAAIAAANPDSLVLDWNYLSMALRGGGVFLPLLMAIFLPGRLPPRAAVAAIAAATLAGVAARTLPGFAVNPLYPALGAAACIVVAGLVWRRLPAPARRHIPR